MTKTVQLPHRPRVAESAMLRRHIIDGQDRFILHDTARAEVIEIDERQLEVLLCCDGTRDLGGVILAVYARGAHRRTSEIEQLLARLQDRGLLADGIAARAEEPERHPERPLELLSDFFFVCEVGRGVCCSTYSSLPFIDDDSARAQRHVPEVVDGRVFLPLLGSVPGRTSAVTMIDGHCPYLDDSTAYCRVHMAGGEHAKPAPCTIYPSTFVDDGEAVRVSVGVECPCILASVGRTDGSPLVSAGAACEGDLPSVATISRLPPKIALTPERVASPADLRAWSDEVCGAIDGPLDGVSVYWSLAAAVVDQGLEPSSARAAVAHPTRPAGAAFGMRLLALSATVRDKLESARAWRSPRDRTCTLSAWLDVAAQRLLEPSYVRERLEEAGDVHEAFHLRAAVFGHQLVEGDGDRQDQTFVQALRDRATRLLLARALAETVRSGSVPAECGQDPALDYPLTAVEGMMRGQGLRSYATGLP